MSEAHPASVRGRELLEVLATRPGGQELIALARGREDVALVGGAVRDLLLGRVPNELDVVVAGEAGELAGELCAALGASATAHERFGTVLVEWRAGRIDIARRRAESYAEPGVLPDVRPGTIEQDLRRRDFTVNAIVLALGGRREGELYGVEHAFEDLAAARLRVLHERSFIDDPTRLLRMARYLVRLDFQAESHTAARAAEAVAAGAIATVSGARVGAELRLALRERDAPAVLEAIDELGVFAALHPRLHFDGALVRAALALLGMADGEDDARHERLLLATLLVPIAIDLGERARAEIYALLDDLEFPAAERDLAIRDAVGMPLLAKRLAGARTPSQIHAAASRSSPQGVALAGAWSDMHDPQGGAGAAAGEWLAELRNVRLLISGEDLLAAGIPAGPEIRLRLEAALRRKLDGRLGEDGRDAELGAALEAQP